MAKKFSGSSIPMRPYGRGFMGGRLNQAKKQNLSGEDLQKLEKFIENATQISNQSADIGPESKIYDDKSFREIIDLLVGYFSKGSYNKYLAIPVINQICDLATRIENYTDTDNSPNKKYKNRLVEIWRQSTTDQITITYTAENIVFLYILLESYRHQDKLDQVVVDFIMKLLSGNNS